MKKTAIFLLFLLSIALLGACRSRSGNQSNQANDTISVPDTGFTGIKKGMSGNYAVNEVTYKNGVREGLTKTFYKSGRVRAEKWYRNDLLQDSVIWYYEEGQIFRITPYRNDTIDGIQKQFYRTGQLKARIGYKKGFRTSLFEEYTKEGTRITRYPELVVNIRDDYKSQGLYKITLQLSDRKKDVHFFRGDFVNGVYDTTKIEKIKTSENKGELVLKKKQSANNDHVGVVAEVLTDFGNRLLIYKRIDLPYNDLD